MGHTLAPYLMQRTITELFTVIATITSFEFYVYLDDILLWNVKDIRIIIEELQKRGIIINTKKSILEGRTSQTYLGLRIDTKNSTIKASRSTLKMLKSSIKEYNHFKPYQQIAGLYTLQLAIP